MDEAGTSLLLLSFPIVAIRIFPNGLNKAMIMSKNLFQYYIRVHIVTKFGSTTPRPMETITVVDIKETLVCPLG